MKPDTKCVHWLVISLMLILAIGGMTQDPPPVVNPVQIGLTPVEYLENGVMMDSRSGLPAENWYMETDSLTTLIPIL
jgi:hypothetical protein